MAERSLISERAPVTGPSSAANISIPDDLDTALEFQPIQRLPVNTAAPPDANNNEGHPGNSINTSPAPAHVQPESLLQRKPDERDEEEVLEEKPEEKLVQRKRIAQADPPPPASQALVNAVPFADTIAEARIGNPDAVLTSGATAEIVPGGPEIQEENKIRPATPYIQRKISIGAPDDPLEREADDMADEVMRAQGPLSPAISAASDVTTPARKAISFIQAKAGTGNLSVPQVVTDGISSSAGKGEGMETPTLSFMEHRFSADFSDVKIHTGSHAAEMSAGINAQAFTVGKDIYFNEGRYAPDTPGGKHLLAHELTHVVQQNDDVYAKRNGAGTISHQGEATIQRNGHDDEEVPVETDLGNGFVLQQWNNHGQALLTYRTTRWMIFQWTGGVPGRAMTASIATTAATHTLELTLSAPFPVTARISHDAEEFIALTNNGQVNFNYHFRFPGTIKNYRGGQEMNTVNSPAEMRSSVSVAPRPLTEGEAAGFGLGELRRPILSPMPPLRNYSRVWQFNTQQEFNRFAAAHPDTNWACIVTPDGKFIAYALTAATLHRFADNIRAGNYRHQFGEEFNGRVSTVFINGQQLVSLEDLRDLYYSDAGDAAMGLHSPRSLTGEINLECAVYEMGDGTYGRKTLTHEQALTLWSTLANMPVDDAFHYEVSPGHRFTELNVFGRGRLIRTLNRRYFRGRDQYNNLIRIARSHGSNPVADGNEDIMYYMEVEASRPDINLAFQSSLAQNPSLATELQNVVYRDVENAGQEEALRLLRPSQERLNQLATNRAELERFIMLMPSLSQEDRVQALAMIGVAPVEPGLLLFMARQAQNQVYQSILSTLSDANEVRRISLGLEGTSMADMLRSHAAETARGIQQMISMLENRTVIAIRAEGDFGVQIRNLVYQRMGFTRLRGNTFPHTGEVDDTFPGPMAGNTASFGSVAEQLYANRIVSMTNEERFMRFLGITAMIIGTAVLIIISGGIGGAVAGAFFAESTTAFAVTEVLVSSVAYTAMNEGAQQLLGHGDIRRDDVAGSAARLGVTTVGNILTFGLFRGLNTMFGALGRYAVGATAARPVAAGTARAFVAEGVRIGGLFATTFMSGIIGARLRNGRYPDGRELLMLFYENAFTLLTLEVGGRLARPLTDDIGIWARARRLGPEFNGRINTLMENIRGLQMQTAEFMEHPSGQPTEIVARQQQLLEQQRDLVTALRAHSRLSRTGDAELIERLAGEELQHIGETMTLIRDIRFIAEIRMRPIGEDNLNFYYRPGSEASIREHYGTDNVHGPDSNGEIRVQQGEQALTFRPEPAAETETPPPSTATRRGGVRGQNYELGGDLSLQSRAGRATRPRRLNVSEIFNYLSNAGGIRASIARRLFGSELTWTSPQSYFDFQVPVIGGGNRATVRVTIKFRGYDTFGAPLPEGGAGPHGADTGPATYSMTYQGGVLHATINIDPGIRAESGARSRDLELIVGHELDEIADITRMLLRNSAPDQQQLDAILAREAQAVVARPGSRARATSLTSHDRATVEQSFRHFGELSDTTITNADARFTAMLETMGLTGRSTSADFIEFQRFLELAMNTSEVPNRTPEQTSSFLKRVEVQWRLLVAQRVLSTATAAQLLPGGQRIITPDLIDHILFPRDTGGSFSGSGIGGGHSTSRLEAVNTDDTSPLYVVREATINIEPGRAAHRYNQYRFRGNLGDKAAAPKPARVPGGPGQLPVPGVHYDPALWEVATWNSPNAQGGTTLAGLPKSAVDDLNTFLPAAELAFADYFRTALQTNPALYGNGRLFRHVYNGVTFMGYYNYTGGTLHGSGPDVSVNSIFIDAQTIP